MLTTFQSPATAYEITLTEISKSKNSKDEKIVKVFEVLDEVLPNLGVYQKIMKIVRQQLFDAVFSNEFTGQVDKHSNASIQRMSYYSLYKKIIDTRDEKNENLISELRNKEHELGIKDSELSKEKTISESLKQDFENAMKTIEKLNTEIAAKKGEIQNIEKKLQKNENEFKQKVENFEFNLNELNNNLDEKNKQINDLTTYKKAYNDIHLAFSPSMSSDFMKPTKRPIGANRKNQITVDILNAKKMEEQILTLINVATEEYDKFIEKQNEYLVDRVKAGPQTFESDSVLSRLDSCASERKSYINAQERNILNKKFELEKINFQHSIRDLKSEYDMIVQHRQSIEEKLYLIEVDRETTEYVRRQKTRLANNQNNANSNNSLQGLEEHYEPIRKGADKDQFSVQDRVFSKWSCTMHTSTNGAIWNDCKQVKYCENCGEKTLICPHKLSLNEAVISVPPGTLLLRFSRPKLQYNQFMIKRSLDLYKRQDPDFQIDQGSVILTNYNPQYPQDLADYQNRDSLAFLNEGNAEIGMPHNFQRIWFDYNQRTTYKRQVPRPFSYERTISLLQQILAFVHHKEVYSDLAPKDIVESLYEYFDFRYELDEIKYAAVFDFFTSINLYAAKSRFIEIFCHVLIGNLDRAVLNYLLYMAEIIDKIEWFQTEDVKIFFAIIYPYCDDDDLDNLTLDFTSFGENKINKKLVWEFIMSLIIKRKDYLVNEMEFRLSSQRTVYENFMNEDEFLRAIEQFFFISDNRQVIVSYRTSLAHCSWDGYENLVPINQLAQIASYFCLIQIVHDTEENIAKIVNESRQKLLENEPKIESVQPRGNQITEYQDEFLKISDIDDMAKALQI